MNQSFIEKFLKGNCNPDETKTFLTWLKTPDSEEKLKIYFKQKWEADNLYLVSKYDSSKVLREINQIIDEQENNGPNKKKWYLRKYIRYAAAITVLCASVLIFKSFVDFPQPSSEANQAESVVTYKKTEPGKKITFRLPDKTIVKLNSESVLHFEMVDQTRLVKLEGEGFFEVFADPDRPFVVQTGKVKTTALGTSFNISHYGDQQTIISLLDGKVKIESANQEQINLSPGEQATHDSDQQTIQKDKWDYYQAFSWKDGVIHFENASFNQVINRLRKWYGAEFNTSGIISAKHYTGTFEQESLENVLESLSFVFQFNYTIEDENFVTLKKNR